METYRQAWSERLRAQAQAERDRAARARALVPALAAELRRGFGARRVVLIGSLARGTFGARSDIDLVADGIDPARLFEACARRQSVAEDIDVDLALLGDLRPRAQRAVTEEGVDL
jgi:predicted nucleotidyltransferase